ncbi:MAG: VanZ family protein [Synechococcales cyanobacterium H12SWP_bin.12]|nr:VanZ family protein [Synechococcales cyanobacterium H12SWP_bin.12]
MTQLAAITKRYWRSLSILIMLLTTTFSLSPLDNLPEAPGSDKTHHLIAYAALAFPTALRKPRQWPIIILGFALYSGLIELIQPLVNRYGEWMDFLANACGLFIGVALASLINKLEKYKTAKH